MALWRLFAFKCYTGSNLELFGRTFIDREDDRVSVLDNVPYDFSELDDMYLSADQYDDLAIYASDALTVLLNQAWAGLAVTTSNDINTLIYRHTIAAWRVLELEYVKEVELRRARVSSFQAMIARKVLLDGEELDDEFLAVISQYQRDVILEKIIEASQPWLEKYDLALSYDSDMQFAYDDWTIIIRPATMLT